MARTDSHWEKTIGGYIKAAYNVLISGASRYLNFGTVSGESGYGIRDNAGTLEFKNSGGAWTSFGAGGGGGITTEQAVDAVAAQIAAGTHSGITITYDDAGDAISFALSDEAFTTAMKNKVDFLTVTATTNLDDIRAKVANVPANTNTALGLKANAADLAAVATSGNYSDLSNTPDLSLYDNLEVAALSSSFPATGSADVLYLESSTGLLYRWDGSSYVTVSAQLALGETSATAYRGDRGKIAYDHTSRTDNPHSVSAAQVGLGNVDNTSDANKPVSTAQQSALDGKANVASPTLTGTTTVERLDYDRSVPTRTVATGVTTSYNIDWSAGREWDITMSGSSTFTFSNAIAGESINVTLRRSAAATFTLPAMEYMDNVNGTTAPAQLDATTSILRGVIYYDGTEYIASFAGNYAVYS